MRLISVGVTAWGPQEITCPTCKAKWEVEKNDLNVVKSSCGDYRSDWPCDKLGFTCNECGKIVLVQTPEILIDEIKRTREKLERDYRQGAR